jgi:hypothetical protein
MLTAAVTPAKLEGQRTEGSVSCKQDTESLDSDPTHPKNGAHGGQSSAADMIEVLGINCVEEMWAVE